MDGMLERILLKITFFYRRCWKDLKQWRTWNWKRILLRSIINFPLFMLIWWGWKLGSTIFLIALVEVLAILPNLSEIATNQLERLMFINSVTTLLVSSMCMLMVWVLFLFYGVPKINEWIRKVTERK